MSGAPTQAALLELADQLSAVDMRLRRVVLGTGLSPSGQATAIALIVSMNLDLFRDAAAALKARAVQSDPA